MRKKILMLVAIMAMGATLITGCGKDKVDAGATKEVVKESETVVETAEPETVVETESTEAIETTETTEEVTETETAIETDPRLEVEIIGECVDQDGMPATVISITNVSGTLLALDTTAASPSDGSFWTLGVQDFYFENDETLYAWVAGYTETPKSDKINEALSERCWDGNENESTDSVVTKETFAIDKTEDMQNFIDSICSDGTGEPYLMMCYQGENLVGITNFVDIQNIPYDADRVEICCRKFVNRQQ